MEFELNKNCNWQRNQYNFRPHLYPEIQTIELLTRQVLVWSDENTREEERQRRTVKEENEARYRENTLRWFAEHSTITTPETEHALLDPDMNPLDDLEHGGRTEVDRISLSETSQGQSPEATHNLDEESPETVA
jgi:hypothetical protein